MILKKIKNNINSPVLLIFLLIIVIIIVIIYFTLFYGNSKNKFVDLGDLEKTTTTSIEQNVNSRLYEDNTLANSELKQCDKSDNLVSVCMNYDGCCNDKSINTGCFCNHPITQSCKTNYDLCIKTHGDIEKCKKENESCCGEYNKIPILMKNFKQLENRDKNSDIICNINSINNLEQQCMALCQTNSECKAFSSNYINCMLYNNVDNGFSINSKSDTKYFEKK